MSHPHTPAPHEKLISAILVDDPDLREVVEEFVNGLNERVAELRNAHAQHDWSTLTIMAHRLKGAGGSYGYPQISALGAAMEQAFKAQDDSHYAAWLGELEELVQAARAGLDL